MADDALAQVMMVTNTTSEKASQYLTLADGDPEQAVTLFFENGGADLVNEPSSSAPTTQPAGPSSRTARTGDSSNPIRVDDDEDDYVEDDEAMARRLQEEMYGVTGAGAESGTNGEGHIRAPIARQSETLVGSGSDAGVGYSDAEMPAAIEARMREFQHRRAGKS